MMLYDYHRVQVRIQMNGVAQIIGTQTDSGSFFYMLLLL